MQCIAPGAFTPRSSFSSASVRSKRGPSSIAQNHSVASAAWAPETPIADERSIRAAAARDAAAPTLVDSRLGAIDLDAPAQMLYTSGTSGNPKGVPLTHNNVGVNARDWFTVLAPLLEENYRDLCWLPMSHIFGFGELCVGNALGWETYLTTPAEVLDVLPEVAGFDLDGVPFRLSDYRGKVVVLEFWGEC